MIPLADESDLWGVVDLLRHGEVSGGRRFHGSIDVPLTTDGRQAMVEAALGVAPWDRIVTSPLSRCRMVADTLALEHDTPLRIDAAFREICFGQWEGMSAAEIMAQDSERLDEFWKNPSASPPPGGEGIVNFQSRVVAAWQELSATAEGSRQLLITHGGVIRAILAEILGTSMAATLAIDISWASVTRIELQRDVARDAILPVVSVVGGRL